MVWNMSKKNKPVDIKLDMWVHNIFKREWLRVCEVDEENNVILLRGHCTFFQKMSRKEFEKMYYASSLNSH